MSGRPLHAISKTDASQRSARSHKKPSPAERKHRENDKLHRQRLQDFELQTGFNYHISTAKFDVFKTPLLPDMAVLSLTLPELRIKRAYDTKFDDNRLRLPTVMTFGSMQNTESNIMWSDMDTKNINLLSGHEDMQMRLLVNPAMPKSLLPDYFNDTVKNFKVETTSSTEVNLHDTALLCTLILTNVLAFCVEHNLNNFTTLHVKLTRKDIAALISPTPEIITELGRTKLKMLNHVCHHMHSRRVEKKPVRDKAIDYLCEQNIDWRSSTTCMNASFPMDVQFIAKSKNERIILNNIYRDIVSKNNITKANREREAKQAEAERLQAEQAKAERDKAEAERLLMEEANAMMNAPAGDMQMVDATPRPVFDFYELDADENEALQVADFIEDDLNLNLESWDESQNDLPLFDDDAYI